jgi:hypothetical protein
VLKRVWWLLRFKPEPWQLKIDSKRHVSHFQGRTRGYASSVVPFNCWKSIVSQTTARCWHSHPPAPYALPGQHISSATGAYQHDRL